MKINEYTVELKYKLAGYERPEDVPYWRLYIYKVHKYEVPVTEFGGRVVLDPKTGQVLMRKSTKMELISRIENSYSMDDLHSLLSYVRPYGTGYKLVAWARKTNNHRK